HSVDEYGGSFDYHPCLSNNHKQCNFYFDKLTQERKTILEEEALKLFLERESIVNEIGFGD
ncbi:MAG: hypothetical protein AABX28_03400, partial [Nanoarchaeota archaeon]